MNMDLLDMQILPKAEDNSPSINSNNIENIILKDEHNYTISLQNTYEEKFNPADCNIKRLCRICLLPKDSLFSESEILNMYLSITSLEVQPENQFPFQICEPCKNNLVFCYDFKSKCQKSDFIFKSLLNDYKIEEEIDTRSIIKSEVKESNEEFEDLQYLDDSSRFDEDPENITLNLIKNEEQARQKNTNISLTDSKTFLKKISSKRKHKTCSERKKSYLCTLCSKKFLKAKTLKAHIKTEHGSEKRPHSCNQCKESFNSEHDLQLHTALHARGDVWTCTECHKKFEARSRLRRHIQRHMQSKRHTCDACGKAFAELYALRRHTRVHTGEQLDKRHACHLCEKRYSSGAALAAHLGRHSGARPCVCACGKAFPSPRLLASHRLVHSDRKPYACQYCEKTFRHESTRNTHHRTHTGEKPYVCANCGKTFIQRSNLILHMRTHTGERPYSCKMCDRKFTSGSSLKNHVRTHTGDKPYSCPVCDKRFARVDMRTHMALHTGERPHACAVCDKRFTSAWRLREHCRLHSGEKPFECANCSDKFATKWQLMKHFKTHQKQKKSAGKREVFIVRQLDLTSEPFLVADKIVFAEDKNVETDIEKNTEASENCESQVSTDPQLDVIQDMPLEVTQEVILQDDSEAKSELLMVGEAQNNGEYQNSDICLSSDAVNFADDVNCDDVNFVTVNEGGVSISSTAMPEGATVKLYQLDQSLVQIHRSGGQLTISKITSKMTANF